MLLQEPNNLRLSSSWLDLSNTMDHEVPQLSGGLATDAFAGLGLAGEFYTTEENIVPKPEPMAMPLFSGIRTSVSSTPVFDSCLATPMEVTPARMAPKEGHVDLSFCVEWTHKKGKRKPQQFWVYCEENQENYLRAYVQIAGEASNWNNFSAVAKLKGNEHTLIFIQNMKQPGDSVEGLELDLSSRQASGHTGHWGSYRREELVLLSDQDFNINLKLIADNTQPTHPDQGYADTVHVVDEGYTDVAVGEGKFLPLELTYRYLFKNRSKGWFRVQATMEFNGQIVVEGKSDLFMFNNPRMVKKKDLVPFQSDEIKFMQCYALACQRAGISNPEAVRAEWTTIGSRFFSPARLEEMLDKSYLTLTQKRKKSGSSTPKKSTSSKPSTARSSKPRSSSTLGKRSASERIEAESPSTATVSAVASSVGPLAKRRRGGPSDVAPVPLNASWAAAIFAGAPSANTGAAEAMDTSADVPVATAAALDLTDEQMDDLVESLWTPWA